MISKQQNLTSGNNAGGFFNSAGRGAKTRFCRPASFTLTSRIKNFMMNINTDERYDFMETRIAVISIIVENPASVEKLNALLHQYGSYILGRMGIPHKERGLSIISVVLDAPADTISALSGKLGMLPDVRTKTIYSKV